MRGRALGARLFFQLFPFAAAALLVASVAAPSRAATRGLESLGKLEREGVEDALAARGLVLELAPEGKVIGQIHVVNHPVFSHRDSYFQLLNVFHFTTREQIIRREVLLQPGDPFKQALVDETVRNLRDGDLSSLVVVLPVKASAPGTVDLLVVTRDLWSLRFNTEFDFGEGTLRSLATSLSENNLFGHRKRFSFAYVLARGNYGLGPTYYDPNIAGTRLTFSGSYRAVYTRTINEREGTSYGARLAYPLYSLATRWGGSISASQSNLVARSYTGNDLREVRVRTSRGVATLPQIYRVRTTSVDSQIVHSVGKNVLHRIAVGHDLSIVRPSFLTTFPVPESDPELRAAYAAAIFPRSEQLSSLYLSYGLFTPRYRIYRDFATYDLREDYVLGPSASFAVSRAFSFLGSEVEYTGVSASAGWTFDWKGGYQRLSFGFSGRVQSDRIIDQSRSASIYLASPVLRGWGRLVADGALSVLVNNTRPNVYYAVGAETGLRGYATGEFFGQASYMAHLEARTTPLAIWALRLGAVVFYDIGHAAPALSELGARQDAGFGIRLLIPQLNFYVLRIDWAIPFQNGARNQRGEFFTTAGLPGRISAGFRQVF